MVDAPPQVALGRCTATLARPPALAVCALSRTSQEFESAGPALLLALGAAALYLCWPTTAAWPTRPRPRPWEVGERIEFYGHRLFDALGEQAGVPIPRLIEVVGDAYRWAVSGAYAEVEVQVAEDFSDAPSEGATS